MSSIIKKEELPMRPDVQTKQKIQAFARGELTWAQLEGMTWERARAIAQMGCDLAMVGRYEEARTLFEGLVAGNPKDAACQAALGTVYQKLGRTEDAMAAYSLALQHDPLNAIALSNRGELKLKAGEADGVSDLGRAVEADPQGTTAAGRRARALLQALTVKTLEAAKAAAGT
jgi:Flp pilus assembly protein TadD